MEGVFVRGLENPFTINGSGTIEFTVSSIDNIMGSFSILFKTFIDDEEVGVAEFTLYLDRQPTGSFILNTTSITLREMKWFTYMDIDGLRNFTVLEDGVVKASFSGLNKAADNSYLNISCECMDCFSFWYSPWIHTDVNETVVEISLRDYVEPGSYSVLFSLTKLMYIYSYDEALSRYVIVDNKTYTLYNSSVVVDVVDVEPPPYILDSTLDLTSVDFTIASNDNLYLDITLDMDAYVEVSEICPQCIDLIYPSVYSTIVLGGSTVTPADYTNVLGELLFGSYYSVTTETPLEAVEGGCGWKTLSQTVTHQEEFPYLPVRVTSGKVSVENASSSIPLTAESIYLLARTKYFKAVARLLNNNPDTLYGDLVREDWVTLPYTYEPPFTTSIGEMSVDYIDYRLLINKLVSGDYEFIVRVYTNVSIDSTRIMGGEEFSRIFNALAGMGDGSGDPVVVLVRVVVSGSREYVLEKYFPLEKLYNHEYYYSVGLNSQYVDEIGFGTKYDVQSDSWIPVNRSIWRVYGWAYLESLPFEIETSLSELLGIGSLRIDVKLYDRFFNITLVSKSYTYDIGDRIREIIGNVSNIPPVASIEYSPKNPVIGETVTFTSNSYDPDGSIKYYRWVIANSTTTLYDVTGVDTLQYTFKYPGVYYVTLYVEDDLGGRANTTVVVCVLGCFTLYEETSINIGDIPSAKIFKPSGSISMVIEVKHIASGSTKTIYNKNPFTVKDILLRDPSGNPLYGEYEVVIKIISPNTDTTTDYYAPEIHLWLTITVSDDTVDILLTETWNTWVRYPDGVWRVVVRNIEPIQCSYGVDLRFRSYSLWEDLYREFLRKFLLEAMIPPQDVDKIVSISIRYEKNTHPHYDPYDDVIILPAIDEVYYLSYTNTKGLKGWTKGRVVDIRPDENMDSFYHEFGHKIKACLLTPSGFYDRVLEYLALGGSHVIDESFPAIFGLNSLSSIGAFDEGHSEFFASLMIEYIRGTIYYNTTTPVLDRAHFYDEYDHTVLSIGNFYGSNYEGYLVEGRVAGFLLALLYNSPDPSLGTNYVSNSSRAVESYRLFWSAMLYGDSFMNRYPMTGREAVYCILAKNPSLWDKAVELNKPSRYNFMLSINPGLSVSGSVWGMGVIVFVRDGDIRASYMSSNRLVSVDVPENYMIMFKADPVSSISNSLSIASTFLMEIRGLDGELLVKASVRLYGNGRIVFLKNGLLLENDVEAYIVYVKGGSRGFTLYGGSVLVIPHSEILFRQVENDTSIYVFEGSVDVVTKSNQTDSVSEGYYIVIDRDGGIVSKQDFTLDDIDVWWVFDKNRSIQGFLERTMGSRVNDTVVYRYSEVSVVSSVEIEPSTTICSSEELSIVINLDRAIVDALSTQPVTRIVILGENNEVIVNETLSIQDSGDRIVYRYRTSLFETGERKIMVYEDNRLVYETTITIRPNYTLLATIILPVIVLAIIIVLVLIKRHRRHIVNST